MKAATGQRGAPASSSCGSIHSIGARTCSSRSRSQAPCRREGRLAAVPIPEVASIASTFASAVEWCTTAAPQPLQPAVQVIGGDIASVVALSPTLPAVARLGVSMSQLSMQFTSPGTMCCLLHCSQLEQTSEPQMLRVRLLQSCRQSRAKPMLLFYRS